MYRNNKEKRAQKAVEWTEKMEREHLNLIQNSIQNTTIYTNELKVIIPLKKEPEVILTDLDSVSAIFEYAKENKKMAILNFSSYKNAGGGFIRGSKAQEECLCYESFLYNVLRTFETKFYVKNRKDLNRSLYQNKALYSSNIHFYRDDLEACCDVITCAAPNFSAVRRQGVTRNENNKVLQSRIQYILDIASINHVDTLILGAFGCGVFGQNPLDVASITKTLLKEYSFKTIVFAILDAHSENYKAFEKCLFDMEDYISKQLNKSHIDRKNGKNKEMDLNDFIKKREKRLKELFPDTNFNDRRNKNVRR